MTHFAFANSPPEVAAGPTYRGLGAAVGLAVNPVVVPVHGWAVRRRAAGVTVITAMRAVLMAAMVVEPMVAKGSNARLPSPLPDAQVAATAGN